MPIYPVEITPGNIVNITADSPEEAFKIIDQDLAASKARQGAAPYLDDLLFDYDTGVQDLTIRARLAAAEKEDLEMVAKKIFGSDGFTINSRGQLAATPQGLARIGEEAEYVEIGGQKIGINRIVDEDAWFSAGDFADFAGTSGPIVGAIAALTPQVRVLKGLQTMFGILKGNDRTARTIAAMIGSGAGKATEEVLESVQGLQNQTAEQVAQAVAQESLIGGAANVAGEAIGVGYKLLFGTRAPTDNFRLFRESTKGRNQADIIKLDESLGREATEKEILSAIKKGDIRVYDEIGLPTQQAFNKRVPGMVQAFSEKAVPGSRVEEQKKYLFRHMTDLFADINNDAKGIGDLTKLINMYGQKTAMSDAQKKELSKNIKKYLEDVDTNHIKINKDVDNHFKEVIDYYTNAGTLPVSFNNTALGQEIRNSLTQARMGVANSMNRAYQPIDAAFEQMRDPFIAREVIEQVVLPRVRNAKQIIEKAKGSTFLPDVKIGDDITLQGNPTSYLQLTLENIERQALNTLERGRFGEYDELVNGVPANFSFKKLRDTMSVLKNAHKYIEHENQLTGAIDDVVEELAAITTDLVENPVRGMPSVLSKLNLVKEDKELVGIAMNQLLKANEYSFKVLKPFDRARIRKIKNETKTGAYDADEIFKKVIKDGEVTDVKSIFTALRNYDDYIDNVLTKSERTKRGLEATNEQTLRDTIKQKLLTDTLQEATDPVTGIIDFTKFSLALKRFEAKSPGKLNAIFNDEVASGDKFLQTLRQIETLKPNIKAAELQKALQAFGKKKTEGLGSTNSGQQFLRSLQDLAESKAAVQKIEANSIIQKLPDATTEEVVQKIFVPGAGKSIQTVKSLISPSAFKEIQNNAMNRILQRAIDYDGLTRKGDIAKIFQGEKLERILQSYGDETLEAMFGKELATELKQFAKTITRQTTKEEGKGQATGTIAAAALLYGISTAPFKMLPVAGALAAMRTLFQNPYYIRLFGGGQKGAGAQIADITERLVRFTAAQELDETATEVQRDVIQELQDQARKNNLDAELESILSDIKSIPPTTSIELPDVDVVPNISSSLSQDPAVRAAILSGGQSVV